MTIVSLKMISGEELITDLKSTIEDSSGKPLYYVVRKPHILQLQQTPKGLGLAFVPWTLSNPDIEEMQIPVQNVMVKFTPSDKLEKQFIQETTSIQIATAM